MRVQSIPFYEVRHHCSAMTALDDGRITRPTPRQQAWPGRGGGHWVRPWDGEGTNFGRLLGIGGGVDVVLYDESGAETATYQLVERTPGCGNGYVDQVGSRSAVRPAREGLRPTPRAPSHRASCSSTPTHERYRVVSRRARALRLFIRRRRFSIPSRSDISRVDAPDVVRRQELPLGDDRRPDTAWADTVTTSCM